MQVKLSFSPPAHSVMCFEGPMKGKHLGTVRSALMKDCHLEMIGSTVEVIGELVETREGNYRIQKISRSMLEPPESTPIEPDTGQEYTQLLIMDAIKAV